MATTTRLGLAILEDATARAASIINANDLIIDNAALVTIANTFTQSQTLADGANLIFGTATGSQIGTSATQKLGLWGATPVVRPASNAELRASLIAIGAITGGINDMSLNGGNLIANQGAFSGAIGGSGTPTTFKRFILTFPTDADYTLAVGEKDAFYIDVQNATITATRNIIVPGAAGGTYCVVNRHSTQSVILKTAANAGITVPALRSRIIGFLGGTVAFAITGSQDWSV